MLHSALTRASDCHVVPALSPAAAVVGPGGVSEGAAADTPALVAAVLVNSSSVNSLGLAGSSALAVVVVGGSRSGCDSGISFTFR